ncbi:MULTISPECIES: YggS family pyridoxal phosphate-dependent enzyme [unclassified Streptococcus]|uniref:YggS family pyridoxal phosphate-dependent enzyme n=1 Tax=unclassified Streptococcus TaxID=2608887 RepID=UPI00107268F3|nr:MULTISPECIES: YggS family pyridoxal phosphate-dependent enzyme [unclassified Streptococcus]MBF0786831.1 YggS family pyridoxal phosphate-dependent enzyme [Streptococcus sp. 19428wC2_LYSM12]MCQ9211071.1 YggS family pyridoxal phosphate-dependent enzyme [Streptococcus sp. B01]MCQ9214346.1 YggS family pyridoxal phosphate-dependent enzyme [Streptococcus sp. O1]TFV06373.1 YggS family pyridoxal phosphate-dependent enzyme [Streptococcus sp. LYSM12]
MSLQQNRDAVFATLEQAKKDAHRSQDLVNVIAVTKYVDSSITKELVATGIQHIGENRVDRFLEKYQALSAYPLTWHLIGSLQRRKVKDVINYVDYFHALDSIKLAQEIQKRAKKAVKCFLQVNISKEESKHGFLVEDLEEVLKQLLPLDKVEVVGLMTMAPFEASHAELMSIFSEAKELQERLAARNLPHMSFAELSMGMSSDFTEAIACGATFVRIGTAFFK